MGRLSMASQFSSASLPVGPARKRARCHHASSELASAVPVKGLAGLRHHAPLKSFWNFPHFGKGLVFFPKRVAGPRERFGLERHRSAVGFPHPLPLRSRVDPLGKKQERRIVSGESANILANPKRHQLMVAQSPGALVSTRRGLQGGAGSLLVRWRKQMSLKWSLDRHADKC